MGNRIIENMNENKFQKKIREMAQKRVVGKQTEFQKKLKAMADKGMVKQPLSSDYLKSNINSRPRDPGDFSKMYQELAEYAAAQHMYISFLQEKSANDKKESVVLSIRLQKEMQVSSKLKADCLLLKANQRKNG